MPLETYRLETSTPLDSTGIRNAEIYYPVNLNLNHCIMIKSGSLVWFIGIWSMAMGLAMGKVALLRESASCLQTPSSSCSATTRYLLPTPASFPFTPPHFPLRNRAAHTPSRGIHN